MYHEYLSGIIDLNMSHLLTYYSSFPTAVPVLFVGFKQFSKNSFNNQTTNPNPYLSFVRVQECYRSFPF